MINDLVYSLLIQEISPHYTDFVALLPNSAVLEQISSFSLNSEIKRPVKIEAHIEPVIQAQSAFAIDLETSTPLLVKDIFSKRSIASITKLLTAMIILDENQLDAEVTVSRNASSQEGSNMRLKTGEKITVSSLLTGMLINSANDAAVALAEFNAGSEESFAAKMNQKALLLGLKQSHFTNAKGFDEPRHYSSAFDTMLIGRAAVNYQFIREVASHKKDTVTALDGSLTHELESTNLLLENPHYTVLGLKTGTTPLAGESVVSRAKLTNGHEVLVVILGSPDRFKETKIVLDWIERSYRW